VTKGTLVLGARDQIKLPNGAFAGVVNLTSTTTVGSDARTGDLWSQGSVVLGSGTVVNGFVKTSGTLTCGSGQCAGAVTGTIQQGQPLAAPTLGTLSVQFMNGAPALTVARAGTTNAAPGDYAAVSVQSGGTLNVRAGDYRFDSLTMTSGSILKVDTSSGPVRIFVRQTMTWQGSVTTAAGDPAKLLLGYVGTTPIALAGPFVGTLLSPNAPLAVPSVSSGYAGGFFAKSLTLAADVVITVRPYQSICEGVNIDDNNACTIDACDSATGT
jgi:hypothetical protein